MKRFGSLALGTLLLAACQDGAGPTDPVELPGVALAVSDGAFGAGGNPDFFFLPPLVPNPGNHPDFEPDEFNGNLVATVSICDASRPIPCPAADDRGGTASVEADHYQFNWNTSRADAGKTFRVRVLVGTVLLGFVDVDLRRQGGGPTEAAGPDANAQRKAGANLPIKFTIESAALCDPPGVEPCASVTINTNQNSRIELPTSRQGRLIAAVDIPSQQTPEGRQVTITMEPCADLDLDLPLFGDCVRITADPPLDPLAIPAVVSVCDVSLFTGLTEEQERLVTLIHVGEAPGAVPEALPHAPENCEPQTVGSRAPSGPGMRFVQQGWRALRDRLASAVRPQPLYANAAMLDQGGGGEVSDFASFFQFALPARMEALAGTEAQIADLDQPVPLPPGVHVTDARGGNVAGATVRFEVVDGTSQIVGTLPVVTGGDGVARVDAWILQSLGGHRLRAFGKGIADPVTNGPQDETFDPFWPDFDVPAVANLFVPLQTGEVFFAGTVPAVGLCSTGTVDGLDTFTTFADAYDAVPAGGWIALCDETFLIENFTIDKPVSIVAGIGATPLIENTLGSAFLIDGVASGTVRFRDLSFATTGAGSVSAFGTYDQVIIETSDFTIGAGSQRGVLGLASTVAGARILVDRSSFTGGQLGTFAVGAQDFDVTNSTFSNHAFSGIQYQTGAAGRAEGNTVTACGVQGCIRAVNLGTSLVEIVNNAVEVDAARTVLYGIVGDGGSHVIRSNTVTGVNGAGSLGDSTSYAAEVAGIRIGRVALIVGPPTGNALVERNTITSPNALAAVSGLEAVDALIVGTDNVVNGVFRGVNGVNQGSTSSVTVRFSDISAYVVPMDGAGLTDLTCNWWGTAAGPQNVPPAIPSSVFTPWAVAPIANAAGGACSGGIGGSAAASPGISYLAWERGRQEGLRIPIRPLTAGAGSVGILPLQ